MRTHIPESGDTWHALLGSILTLQYQVRNAALLIGLWYAVMMMRYGCDWVLVVSPQANELPSPRHLKTGALRANNGGN